MRASLSISHDRSALMDEWRRIYALSDATVFLSPAWIETMLETAPSAAGFGFVRVLDDLRGVYGAALVSVPRRRPFAFICEAHLNETGVPHFDRVYIEYNDVLLTRDAPAGAREAAVEAIFDGLGNADQFVFRNATPQLADAVETVSNARRCAFEVLNRQPTFQIDLRAAGGGRVFQSFSPSLRAKIRRSIRRYEERGEVTIDRPQSPGERAVAWTELMRLHAQTWSRRGKRGAFSERAFRAFHEHFIERYPQHAEFVRLIAGGETLGVLYNFVAGDRICNYQSGFKYEADNQLAPGFVCHALAADRYRELGFSIYDMMGGDADYKRRLGGEGVTLTTVAVTRKGLRARLRSSVRSLWGFHGAGTHQT